MKNRALLLFSGGQDSTTVLAWCLKKFDEVHLITFDYGQNHLIEIATAKKILASFKRNFSKASKKIKSDIIFRVENLNVLSKNSLTSKIKMKKKNGLPNSFVPGRNILFYTLSSAYAYDKGINNIVSGVCETDYSGYPDCRDETIKAVKKAINLGMEKKYNFYTPLMKKDKADTWEMAYNLGGKKLINLILKDTHTCYKGQRKKLHEWGYGCDKCPACIIRKKGWYKFIYKKNYEIYN